jgi:hypothetical protein
MVGILSGDLSWEWDTLHAHSDTHTVQCTHTLQSAFVCYAYDYRYIHDMTHWLFYVVHTLTMSDFCIYPHSGIPQGLRGLILGKEPFKRTLVQDSPVGRRPEPAQPEVMWFPPPLISIRLVEKIIPQHCFFPQVSISCVASFWMATPDPSSAGRIP